jgi:alpha-1,3-rhamnosyltransferase
MTNAQGEGSISVVVPSHNHAQFVGTCLRSIIKQSHAPNELLVIDDGSTDDSPRIISAVLDNCPFPAELIVRENRGLCATLNQALSLTRADYFAYLSSDDLWLQSFLQARLRLLRNRPNAVLAYGHAFLIDEDNEIVDRTLDWADYQDGDVRSMLLQTTAPMSPTVVYVRAAVERFGWNEKSKLEDFELYLKLSSIGEFAFDPEVLSAWRAHETNTSWNQQLMLDEHLRALKQMAPQLKLSVEELRQLECRISFRRAEDFLRVGDKKTASKLIRQNFDAATPAILARLAARMLLPRPIVQARRERKHTQNKRRFGKIEI